jgi:hypothetical protein
MWIHADPDPDPQPSDAGGDSPGAGGREGGEGGPRGGLSLQAGTERLSHLEPPLVLLGLQQGRVKRCCDPDPDPAYLVNADPDPAFLVNAYPDPDPGL